MTKAEFVESRSQKVIDEREQGRLDCEAGNQVKFGMTEDYYQGYAGQYEKEQVLTARS
jgi:hypothetical protein